MIATAFSIDFASLIAKYIVYKSIANLLSKVIAKKLKKTEFKIFYIVFYLLLSRA